MFHKTVSTACEGNYYFNSSVLRNQFPSSKQHLAHIVLLAAQFSTVFAMKGLAVRCGHVNIKPIAGMSMQTANGKLLTCCAAAAAACLALPRKMWTRELFGSAAASDILPAPSSDKVIAVSLYPSSTRYDLIAAFTSFLSLQMPRFGLTKITLARSSHCGLSHTLYTSRASNHSLHCQQ